MENELRALEERIGQLAEVARRLRAENAELRQSLLLAQNDTKTMREKVESASMRLHQLLERMPEESA